MPICYIITTHHSGHSSWIGMPLPSFQTRILPSDWTKVSAATCAQAKQIYALLHIVAPMTPWKLGRTKNQKQANVRPSATGQHGQPLDLSMSTLMTWIIVKGSSFISQKLLLPKHVVFIGIGSKTAPSFSDLVGDCRQHSQGSRQRLCRELARS